MKYRNKKIKDLTNEQILYELIQRFDKMKAPKKIEFIDDSFKCVDIQIRKDNCITIYFNDDDFQQIEKTVIELNQHVTQQPLSGSADAPPKCHGKDDCPDDCYGRADGEFIYT